MLPESMRNAYLDVVNENPIKLEFKSPNELEKEVAKKFQQHLNKSWFGPFIKYKNGIENFKI